MSKLDKAKQEYTEKCLAEGLPSKKEIFLNLFGNVHIQKWLKEVEGEASVEVDESKYEVIARMWKQCDEVAWAIREAVCGPEPKEEDK